MDIRRVALIGTLDDFWRYQNTIINSGGETVRNGGDSFEVTVDGQDYKYIFIRSGEQLRGIEWWDYRYLNKDRYPHISTDLLLSMRWSRNGEGSTS